MLLQSIFLKHNWMALLQPAAAANKNTNGKELRLGFCTQAINALSPLSGVSGSLAYTVEDKNQLKISLETLRQSLDNAVINAQLWLQNAERAYTQAQNARDKQQRVLETQIQDAQLAYQDAMRQASKFICWCSCPWCVMIYSCCSWARCASRYAVVYYCWHW